jgi:hypothetical protein
MVTHAHAMILPNVSSFIYLFALCIPLHGAFFHASEHMSLHLMWQS